MVRATPLIPENPWNFLPKCLSGSAHFIQGARDGKCQIAEAGRLQIRPNLLAVTKASCQEGTGEELCTYNFADFR